LASARTGYPPSGIQLLRSALSVTSFFEPSFEGGRHRRVLLNAIPFLGSLIALAICLSYALVAENIEPLIPGLNSNNLPPYVLILIGITHVLDDVVFQPFVLGGAVNIHPLVVVVAIIAGSLIMGLWRMIFAISTVVVVKTAVETLFKELRDYRMI
jgi:predicted PurR-regulated permease PerM